MRGRRTEPPRHDEADAGDVSGGWFSGRPASLQWVVLVASSTVLVAVMEWAGIPATLLMGPMAAGIILGTNGATIRATGVAFIGGQAVIGCLIANAIDPQVVGTFLASWQIFLPPVIGVLAASSFLGWMLSRWSTLPGSTAVWGSSPGGATAMMLMAQAFGADAKLVAFMQYLRVVFVAAAAALVARFWVHASGAGTEMVWLPAIHWPPLLETLALAGIGGWVGVLLRIPAGAFLVPMIVGAVLHATELMTIELPEWLLAASYAFVGWNIGLRFTRPIVLHASRALPHMVLSILALLAFCGGLAVVLNKVAGIDPLTAYLAMSPGGMDSIAIIAAAAKVDLPFVMTLQTVRFVLVILLGPSLARGVAKWTETEQGSSRPE